MKTLLLILVLYCTNSGAIDECHQLVMPFLNEHSASNSKLNDIDITKYGLEETLANRVEFERLYAQCMSPEKNQIKSIAQNQVNKTFLAMSMATTIIGYSETNWQKQKDFEWYGRLGYSLTVGAIFGQIYLKLLKDDGNRFQFLIKDYLLGRTNYLTWAKGDEFIFGYDKKILDKLNTLKHNTHFKSDIQKLKSYANSESLYMRYKNEVIAYLCQQDEINLGIGVHLGVDFDHLTPKDLNDPEIAKIVMASILAQEYETSSKGIITLGSMSADNFAFDSIYSVLKIPKDILLFKMTNQIMCLNLHNTSRGLTQIIGINTLNQILFADYYGITYRVLKQDLTPKTK